MPYCFESKHPTKYRALHSILTTTNSISGHPCLPNMSYWRGIVAAFSCSTTSASSQITNRRDRMFPIFTLGPELVGGAPPPSTPRLAALAFLHPSAQATVAAKCRTFSHAFLQNSYQRSLSQSFLSKQAKSI
jgi:hypothetical protein